MCEPQQHIYRYIWPWGPTTNHAHASSPTHTKLWLMKVTKFDNNVAAHPTATPESQTDCCWRCCWCWCCWCWCNDLPILRAAVATRDRSCPQTWDKAIYYTCYGCCIRVPAAPVWCNIFGHRTENRHDTCIPAIDRHPPAESVVCSRRMTGKHFVTPGKPKQQQQQQWVAGGSRNTRTYRSCCVVVSATE